MTRGTQPRWHAHPYNRAELYRLTAALGWLPRRMRLGLARRVGHLAQSFLPNERAIIRKTMATMTGATGRQLAELTTGVFGEFAMCFSDLVTASRHPRRLGAYVGAIQGVGIDRLEGLDGPVISLTAHIGNWELAGRILAQHSARTTHVVVAVEEAPVLERWLRRNGSGLHFVPRSEPTVSLTLMAALRRGEAGGGRSGSRVTARSVIAATCPCRSSAARPRFRSVPSSSPARPPCRSCRPSARSTPMGATCSRCSSR